MKSIKIATNYSDTPYGRYRTDGEFSGQRFREEFLTPALKSGGQVSVDIDDVEGYGSSFLDEAFGGLVRLDGFAAQDLHKQLEIKNSNSDYVIYRDLIWKYIDEARPKKSP